MKSLLFTFSFFASFNLHAQSWIQQASNFTRISNYPFSISVCSPQVACGCNTDIMRERSFIGRYVDAVIREFETVAQHLDSTREISQVHWGGGTPNAISMKYIRQIMDKISEKFRYTPGCEIAMECNPAYLTHVQMEELSSMKFNRLSIGIQDFDSSVLKMINRKPSLLPEEELVKVLSAKNIGVNLDFVYGLPGQTPDSFEQTIQRAVNMNPDRIVTFSYAHVPWVKSAQKVLEQYGIPDSKTKLMMFERAYAIAVKAGFIAVGLDHFAKPDDELSQALKNRQLHRNFMGYCSRENTGQVYAFGATSISQLHDAYSQNCKSPVEYIEQVNRKGTAVEKGYAMTPQDVICNAIIQEIMCNNRVDLNKIAGSYFLSVQQLKKMLKFDDSSLELFIEDNLINYLDNKLEVKPSGKFFLRNIAMVFDPLLTGKETNYSKTV
jgi:oxygen-independent coproporphyrinogen-3 oxidase